MKRVSLLLALLLPFALIAQTPFTINSQRNIRLPQGLDNLSTIDNQLYGFCHLLVSAPISQKTLPTLQPDTMLAKLIPDADYVVRNPRDSILYFTRRDADGITNYIGDLRSEDGVIRTRIMCEMNMPHWPTPEMSRQIFEFFSHFSRDRKTGESIYHP